MRVIPKFKRNNPSVALKEGNACCSISLKQEDCTCSKEERKDRNDCLLVQETPCPKQGYPQTHSDFSETPYKVARNFPIYT